MHKRQSFINKKEALFFPPAAVAFAHSISLLPLQMIESIVYVTIVYWSAGLSDDYNGSRFFTFVVIAIMFAVTISQLYRLIAVFVADIRGAVPIAGIILVVMILFSGFIQPKALISDGWVWFYWMNPVAWALKAVTINEFASPKYNFLICTDYFCTEQSRYGDFVLEEYGNPTDQRYIWYSFAVLIAEWMFLFVGTNNWYGLFPFHTSTTTSYSRISFRR
jgi:hypothetical protein